MEHSTMRQQTTSRQHFARPLFHAPTSHALLQAHGKAQYPSIRSITRSGIKLDGAFGLKPGDDVMVKLPTHQALIGTVDWSVGGFCSVTFATPLAEDDEALADL